MESDVNKNMKVCKVCGKEIAKKTKKCIHCGADQRNFFARHKILTGVLVIVVLIIIASLGGDADPNSKDATKQDKSGGDSVESSVTSEEDSDEQSKNVEEIIAIAAKQLQDEYDANEVRADKEYKGKMAEVTGVVESIDVMFGQTSVLLTGGGDFEITGVQCFFKDEQEIEKVEELNKGDEITIIGKVGGKSVNVHLEDCKISSGN